MEVARQNLRRAEVSAFVHTPSSELDFCFLNQSHVTGLRHGSTCWLKYAITFQKLLIFDGNFKFKHIIFFVILLSLFLFFYEFY